MNDLLLPFAIRTTDGLLVSPEEVPRGLACACVCPGCNHAVQARHGTERVWHFAHAKASDCAGAYEKSVHEAAKQMLRDRKELLLPAVAVTVQAVDAFHRIQRETETIFDATHMTLETCKPGQVIEDVSPDLVGTLRGRQLLIEVRVFHRLMPEKLVRLKRTGLAVLEIDLSEFKKMQATRERLEEALFAREHNRHWVWHPSTAEVRERLTESLHQRLAAIEAEWTEHERKAEAVRAERRVQRARLEALRKPDAYVHFPISPSVAWRAGFPEEESWLPARAAFCERHSLQREKVDVVLGAMTKRSELARTTPIELAEIWAAQLGVKNEDIFRYYVEGGYVI